ncbi:MULTISPECIES: helix-turn-helix domain-containing protein [Haloferax]|uniref:Bacterio-opsin activator n=2 Tax=Haloferax gibbonsii TaxID=35746 RepID=A0A0K1IWF0_HALGI|nr:MULTISPECIES: helix-turn-helix domain-containing protein [Haloferax]AKU08867.1 bacterio-opsin activator [Haloferax gibbonsii]ELZ81612.1 bacterio-opsin activator-like protein [Haloferax gibbonsii ATCC 33959]QOS11946.1 HTH-10 family transcription regulator [Haloferax gibbonsii]RDZ51995.1 bacterio-opsin activator [Haloferax sp. Atlit-4N]REA01337.1 bacterio-opsin activator [Haloferax sp. Atlit-6N]
MKHAQFSVDYPDRLVHPLQRGMMRDSPVDRAELLMWSPTADATTLFWFDGDRDAADALVSGVDSLVRAHFVEGAEGTYGFLHQRDYEFADPLLGVVADARVIFLPPVVFHATGSVRFEAVGEVSALSAFYDDIAALGDLTVERVKPFDRRRSPSQLTDRQRAALETAVSAGYYEIPREGSVADVADALDCSTSTAGELLRKAEATVLREFVGSR